MSIRTIAIAYVSTAVIFLAIDAVWLGTMANRLYKPAMGDMMLENFAVTPALIFYAIYVVGMIVFAVLPALESGRWTTALWSGALLGLVAYATYDLTNHATLKNWPLVVTLADLCWGTFATAVASAAASKVTMWATKALPVG
ncbi:DUF2177 family protein [soil metagenome]